MSKKSCTFARQMRADGKPTNAAISINHKMTDQMASIQDIQALEERIYEVDRASDIANSWIFLD